MIIYLFIYYFFQLEDPDAGLFWPDPDPIPNYLIPIRDPVRKIPDPAGQNSPDPDPQHWKKKYHHTDNYSLILKYSMFCF